MRAFVFTKPSLTSRAGQFVWLDVNSDESRNAAFLEKFPVDAWPTFLVLDPQQERVALRWVGSMNVAQVHALLDQGRRLVTGEIDREGSAPDELLVRADRLYADREYAGAAGAYAQAVKAAPETWPAYARAVESLLFAYQMTDAYEMGARLAREALPRLAGTPSTLNLAIGGLDCALELPETQPDRGELIALFESELRRALGDSTLDVAADDRSSGYGLLVQARKRAEDETGAREAAEQWAAFLEAEAAEAQTPEQRTVFDSHRLSVYLELGQPERAIPLLEASERELPDDYNPPARLALAFKALGRWQEALEASDRALERVTGPRRLRVLTVRAEVCAESGDESAARRTLEQAIAYAEALPPGQRSERALSSLRKKLEGL